MCLPYVISDPPQKKRPRHGAPQVKSVTRKGIQVQPAYVEISPRLTYVASPKPKRSALPHEVFSNGSEPCQLPEVGFLEGLAAGEKASRQEEVGVNEDEQVAKAAFSKAAPEHTPTIPPPVAPVELKQQGPSSPRPEPSTAEHPQPLPPAPPEPQYSPSPNPNQHQPPPEQRGRSPHSYTHRPPAQHQKPRGSRSLSSDSSISRRSFERLKRNVHVLWDRLRALERWKEERERESRQGRRGWELGHGRREGSLTRERREASLIRERRERYRRRDDVRSGHEQRWDWEGGGSGRR